MNKEQNIFLELKDSLKEMRDICLKQIDTRLKMIENKDSEVFKLLSHAEQIMMLQELEKEQKNNAKSLHQEIEERKEKLKKLEKKFNNIEE